jgi:hypothetical protein
MAFTRGFGPGSSYRFTSYRHGSLDGRNSSFRYPSQWWDVAHMELPTSVKHLFKWCRYHVLVNPLISSVTRKMAAYPITKVVIDDREEEGFDKNRKRWEDLIFQTLDINRLQIEIGLDYQTYGNCIVSIFYPFHKYLGCKHCKKSERIKRLKFRQEWDFRNFEFTLHCKTCGNTGTADVKDVFYKAAKNIRVIRWSPEDLDIDFNPITQSTEFAYKIPSKIRKKVLQKNRRYLEELPQKFLESMKVRRPVILTEENVFHFKAPTPSLSSNDQGWGYPPILPALKDSFHLQIMKKAQEAVMLEHLVPLDIIYPASADAQANPYITVNLSDWKAKIEAELVQWRMDPNYKPILPLPVGYQRIGGNGRALMLTQEIRAHSEHIIVGMGVPQEFAFGGLSWTGSSVSLRMLENQFMSYRDMHDHFISHFLIPNVARFMGWKEISVHMKAFKMADDIQAKQLLLSLNQLRKVSDQTLLAEFDKDSLAELRLIEQELRRSLEITKLDSLYKAQIQGESQQVMTKYQTEAQIAQQAMHQKAQMKQQQAGMAPPQPPQEQQQEQDESQVNVIDLAEAWAKKIGNMDPVEQARILSQMESQSPNLHQLVIQKIQVTKALTEAPLPEQGPPRRDAAAI